MEKNTRLPKEVVEEIERNADLQLIRTGNTAYNRGYRDGEVKGATAYATRLQEAEEKIKELERWKAEAISILNPIWEYADTLKVPLGKSKTEAVIDHAKQAKDLLEQIDFSEASEYLPDRITNQIKTFLYGE